MPKTIGECSICLKDKPLSYEHVPPRNAFNSASVIGVGFDQAMKLKPWENIRHGKIKQQGAGFESLCEQCNNSTGDWYADDYTSWTLQAHRWLERVELDPNVWPIFGGYPLRFIKQAATIMLSMLGPDFTRAHPHLRRFVLERQRRYMGPELRVYAYYNTSKNRARYSGVPMVKGGFDGGGLSVYAEVAKYPFGLVFALNGLPPDDRLVDITDLTQYGYDDFAVRLLRMPSFPVVLPMCGIYLTPEIAERVTDPEIGPLISTDQPLRAEV